MPSPVKHQRFWESQSVIVVGAFYDRNTGFIFNNGCHFIGTGIGHPGLAFTRQELR